MTDIIDVIASTALQVHVVGAVEVKAVVLPLQDLTSLLQEMLTVSVVTELVVGIHEEDSWQPKLTSLLLKCVLLAVSESVKVQPEHVRGSIDTVLQGRLPVSDDSM